MPPFVTLATHLSLLPVTDATLTFERPRGATRYGTRSDCALASPAVLVATIAPRAVRTPPGPITKELSLGMAVNAPLGIVSVTLTSTLPPAGTVTLPGETPTTAPSWPPLPLADSPYVASEL